MQILITGAEGFIGKNLQVRLQELNEHNIITFSTRDSIDSLSSLIANADIIYHLAGVNRPKDPQAFINGNYELTSKIIAEIKKTGKAIPIILTSSTQAVLDNPYGKSKLAAEEALKGFSQDSGNPIFIYRLPNVFGKWAKPNYNSAVATFCNNIANGLPIQIHDRTAKLRLVYIDDVIDSFVDLMHTFHSKKEQYIEVPVVYDTTVGEVADIINSFTEIQSSGITERVGAGLVRALYSTYLSYLPKDKFSYSLIKHEDPRGSFVEMLKTKDSGQFSYFTAHPGVTRGGHYHHTKTEKFLVIKGTALYRFRHIVTGEYFELTVEGSEPTIVETIPGWSHDITNIGTEELVVMLWANEIFDRQKPDTVTFKVN